MKSLNVSMVMFSFVSAGFVLGLPVAAQNQVEIIPEALMVTSTRPNLLERLFKKDVSETRNLALRVTDSVEAVQIDTVDLYNSEGDRIFSRNLIDVEPDLASIAANNLQNLPVTFDLQSAPSGEYQGSLLFSYADGETSIPITVRIKDPWPLPLLLLVLGVLLGTTTSSYTRWGRSVDQLTVSMNDLRAQVEADSELPKAFTAKIFPLLHDATELRGANQLSDAQQAVLEASGLWRKWARERASWLAIISEMEDLDRDLTQQPQLSFADDDDATTRYTQALRKELKEVFAGMAALAEPSDLVIQVKAYKQQLTAYERLRRRFDQLREQLNRLKGDTLTPEVLADEIQEKLSEIETKAAGIWRQIVDLLPADSLETSGINFLETETGEAMDALSELEKLKAARVPKAISRGFELGEAKSPEVVAAIEEVNAEVLAPVSHEIMAPTAPQSAEQPSFSADENFILKGLSWLGLTANQRLQLFSTAGYLTTIVFLAGTGFNQLYLEKPTFGADGPVDYFALLAWGFGAEATRNAITNVLRRTDADKV
ncbi:MAG: hypothetical protein AAFQ74_09250 [Cyanobacteria bacterium J06623_4]